jgi:pimeloyl-ACP methyl ester carboxylesterase
MIVDAARLMPETAAATGERMVTLPDGRQLAYRQFGDPNGRAVIALHGTPGSRLKYASADAPARAAGLRLISPDRWGYGDTSAPSRPTLADYAGDISALADGLGLDRFAVVGISGGGPFAAAIAAGLADRVSALAMVAPVGPIAGSRLREMSAFHTLCFRMLPRVPGAVPAVFQTYRALLALAPHAAMRLAVSRSAAVDRASMADRAICGRLAETFVAGLRSGVAGPTIDLALFGRPWGINLAAIRAPTRVWMGLADRNVPAIAVRRLACAIARADLIELPGAGHLWVAHHDAVVMGWLASVRP